MERRCEKCKWFKSSGTYLDNKWGRCRRFPPGRYWNSDSEHIIDGHNIVMDFDCCGEFTLKGW